MSITSHCLIKHDIYFTPYDTKWIPCSSRLCVVGANSHGAGTIAVYGLVDKRLELKQEVCHSIKSLHTIIDILLYR